MSSPNILHWFVVTYDVNKYHSLVKQHCVANGFCDTLNYDGKTVPLPNTTLVGQFATAEQAASAFVRIVRSVAPWGLKIERVLACPLNPCVADAA